MKKQLIARADDLGSSNSANQAIERVVGARIIRNVSVMACGPFVESAAEMLADRKEICFGMHTTLNAEWDKVKWGPVGLACAKMEPVGLTCAKMGQGGSLTGQDEGISSLGMESGNPLVDENGYFLPDPSLFLRTKPSVEQIMQEVDAQLERLYKLGFDIRYIDSHMFSEAYVPGMDEAMEAFARKKGLVDHMYFYHLLPNMGRMMELGAVPDGQYFIVAHPSLDTEEMRRTGNAGVSGMEVAKGRARETQIFSSPDLRMALETAGFECIRYDEAACERRMTVAELQTEMAKLSESEG